MPLMDEFKEERAQIKNQPFKKRLEYFWDYNKTPVLIGLLVVVLAAITIYQVATRKDTALWVAMVDCSQNDMTADAYEDQMEQILGINTSEETVSLDASYKITAAYAVADDSVTETLAVRVATGEIDAFMSSETIFSGYAMTDAFVDLRTVLSPEQLEKYGDSFYYMDYALIEAEFSSDSPSTDSSEIYDVNHRSPEGMKDPVPMGIYVTGNEEFQNNYLFHDGQETVIGIVYNHCDINYIMTFLETISE